MKIWYTWTNTAIRERPEWWRIPTPAIEREFGCCGIGWSIGCFGDEMRIRCIRGWHSNFWKKKNLKLQRNRLQFKISSSINCEDLKDTRYKIENAIWLTSHHYKSCIRSIKRLFFEYDLFHLSHYFVGNNIHFKSLINFKLQHTFPKFQTFNEWNVVKFWLYLSKAHPRVLKKHTNINNRHHKFEKKKNN